MSGLNLEFKGYNTFLEEIKQRISLSQQRSIRAVNTELIMLYWHIGRGIIVKQQEEGWGTKVIDKLSQDLSAEFPGIKGFSPRNLKYMRKFAEEYKEIAIVQQAAAQLPWFHIVILLEKIDNSEERMFYINKVLEYGWSRNVMIHHIESQLYKREGKAITNFTERLPMPQSDLATQALKDPYCFDFLSLGQEAHEREIEKELTKHIQKFLLELGAGFAFVGNQYKIEVEDEEYYIDMLFYHLKLRCYVVIELKAVKFTPEAAGKLNFYLSVIDDKLKTEHDNPSIGIILCKQKNKITAEYSLKNINKPIGISEYRIIESIPEELKTSLPTIEELEAELNKNSE